MTPEPGSPADSTRWMYLTTLAAASDDFPPGARLRRRGRDDAPEGVYVIEVKEVYDNGEWHRASGPGAYRVVLPSFADQPPNPL